ncbi:hypothetical protein [Kitasatospora sp. NPDC051914]|uniref:hypothetical protein n=1 Tax=Kitasatospora sp. NPDC051914 TaxID=3154945 RepID=UPI003447BCBF
MEKRGHVVREWAELGVRETPEGSGTDVTWTGELTISRRAPTKCSRMAARARTAGVDVALDITADVPHVFQSFAGLLDEADQALDRGPLPDPAHPNRRPGDLSPVGRPAVNSGPNQRIQKTCARPVKIG